MEEQHALRQVCICVCVCVCMCVYVRIDIYFLMNNKSPCFVCSLLFAATLTLSTEGTLIVCGK